MTADVAGPAQARLYVYGVCFADAGVPKGLTGVGGAAPTLVPHGELAALVTELPQEQEPGTPEDLVRHSEVLDAVAVSEPVLPARFGTVAEHQTDLLRQLLDRPEVLADSLRNLAGAAQFTLQVSYERDALLSEMVAQDPELARLRQAIAGTTEHETRNERIRLGELVVRRFEALRPADAQAVLDVAEAHTRQTADHETSRAEDVLAAAFLVDHEHEEDFVGALEDLARQNAQRLHLRLLGPQAAYDFVGEVL